MGRELRETFALDLNVYVIVVDNSTNSIGANGRFFSGSGARSGKNSGVALIPRRFRSFTLGHELGHAFGLQHDFRDRAYIMSYGFSARSRLSACNAEFLAVHPYFNIESSIDSGPSPSIELVSPATYPAGSERVPVHLEVSDPEGLHQSILFAATLRPHPAAGFFEVKTCRGLSGVQNDVVEFDYDGDIPSAQGASLSNPPVHSIYTHVVDMNGDMGRKHIILAETSPNHIATFEGHTHSVNTVSLSRNGIIASGSYDHTIRLWDVSTKKNIAILEGHKGPVSSVSFSPDDTLLASAGNYRGGTIRLWRVPTEGHIAIFGPHGGSSVHVVSFSPDGMILASGAGSTLGTVELWDM